ncbi:hypothetical protein ACLBWJ_10265 [Microbacterium sp. M4A5_1d]
MAGTIGKRNMPPTTSMYDMPRGDRWATRTMAVLAGLMGVALAAGQIRAAVTYAWSPDVTLTLLAQQELPVVAGRGVATANITSVALQASELASSTRALFAAGSIALGITAVLVAAALSWFLLSISAERPLRPALRRFCTIAGCALLLGPAVSTSLAGFASMEAAFQFGPAFDDLLLPGFSASTWGMALPIVGVSVICLGFLLRRMERLERDTEGLV